MNGLLIPHQTSSLMMGRLWRHLPSRKSQALTLASAAAPVTSATDVVVAAGENEDGVDEALAQDIEFSEHCGVFQHSDGSTVKHLDHLIFRTSMSDTLIPKSSSEVVQLQELAEQEKLFLKCLRKRAEREAKKKLEKEQKKAAAKKLKEDARLWISGSQGAQEPSYSVDLSGFVMEMHRGSAIWFPGTQYQRHGLVVHWWFKKDQELPPNPWCTKEAMEAAFDNELDVLLKLFDQGPHPVSNQG